MLRAFAGRQLRPGIVDSRGGIEAGGTSRQSSVNTGLWEKSLMDRQTGAFARMVQPSVAIVGREGLYSPPSPSMK